MMCQGNLWEVESVRIISYLIENTESICYYSSCYVAFPYPEIFLALKISQNSNLIFLYFCKLQREKSEMPNNSRRKLWTVSLELISKRKIFSVDFFFFCIFFSFSIVVEFFFLSLRYGKFGNYALDPSLHMYVEQLNTLNTSDKASNLREERFNRKLGFHKLLPSEF